MMDLATRAFNTNVTHRVCTHRLVTAKMRGDARRHPHPIWPRHPPHTRGTGDQSGRGRREMRVAPDVLQWRRAGRQECVTCQHREDCQRIEEKPA
jgi:hypothetical protein